MMTKINPHISNWQNGEWDQIFRNIRPTILEWVRKSCVPSEIWEGISPRKVFHDDELCDAVAEYNEELTNR